MPTVTTPDETILQLLRPHERDNEDRGCSDECYRVPGVSARAVVAAWRGVPVVGNARRTCGTPNCTNPRHLRLASDAHDLTISAELWRESNGCHLWLGPFVSNLPMLRFTGRNMNVLHLTAERDLPDYSRIARELVGQTMRGFPRRPIVTRFCGRRDCINSAHYLVSRNPIGSLAGWESRMDRDAHLGNSYWTDREELMGDVTVDSVRRWRGWKGLPVF